MKVKKLDFLISLYIFCIVAAELMGGKTFQLISFSNFQLNASVSIFLVPLIFTINDVVAEVYGAERIRSVIRASLIIIFILLLFSILAISLPPSTKFASKESMYDSIFGTSIRISTASLIAFALADFLDVFVFVKIKKALGQSKLWLRNNLSNFIAQFIDTTVFVVLAFYAINESVAQNISFLFSLILPYWLLKCSLSVIETPFVYIGVKWLRKDL
ncbi:MAG: VUT family protein [Chitinophagaceae bacterium]|nr:MAG: VUT family protein [Chitinophagaceae bacterium]